MSTHAITDAGGGVRRLSRFPPGMANFAPSPRLGSRAGNAFAAHGCMILVTVTSERGPRGDAMMYRYHPTSGDQI